MPKKNTLLKVIASDLGLKSTASLPEITQPIDIQPGSASFAYRTTDHYRKKTHKAQYVSFNDYIILQEAEKKKDEGKSMKEKKQYLYTVKPSDEIFGQNVSVTEEGTEFEFPKGVTFQFINSAKINGKKCQIFHLGNPTSEKNTIMNNFKDPEDTEDDIPAPDYTGTVYILSTSKLHQDQKSKKEKRKREEAVDEVDKDSSSENEEKKKPRTDEQQTQECAVWIWATC